LGKLSPQPLDILPGYPPGPPDLIGWNSFRPKPSVNCFHGNSKFFGQLTDCQIVAHSHGPSFRLISVDPESFIVRFSILGRPLFPWFTVGPPPSLSLLSPWLRFPQRRLPVLFKSKSFIGSKIRTLCTGRYFLVRARPRFLLASGPAGSSPGEQPRYAGPWQNTLTCRSESKNPDPCVSVKTPFCNLFPYTKQAA